jgi:hypothetical protein
VPDQGYKSPTAFRLRTTLLERSRPCPRGYAADHDAGRTHWSPSPATAGLTAGHPLVNVMWCSPDACIFLSSHSAEGEAEDATAGQGAGGGLRSWAPRTWCSW